MPWLAAVGAAVAGTASGGLQYLAQNEANEINRKASEETMAFNREQWEAAKTAMQPYSQFGSSALPQLGQIAQNSININATSDPGYNRLTSLTDPGDFQFSTEGDLADPSYQWRLNQGLAAVNSSAAAKGGYFSGNTGQALMDYGQGAASQEYSNQFARYNQALSNYMNRESFNADQYNQAWNRQVGENQNQFNQFSTIANMGMNAINSTNQYGSNFAANSGNVAMNQAANAAAGAQNSANIWGNVISNASNQFTSYLGNKMMADALNRNQYAYGPAY